MKLVPATPTLLLTFYLFEGYLDIRFTKPGIVRDIIEASLSRLASEVKLGFPLRLVRSGARAATVHISIRRHE